MKRRTFISALGASMLCARLHAAPATSTRFLLIFLRGGYDATNVLVPASDFYYEARPTIALPREALVRLDADWSLHPALRESIHPLYEEKQVLFVPFAGSENLSRSHFQTQDSIELGQGEGFRSGFLNRLSSVLGSSAARPISFTAQLPVVFRGEVAVTNVALAARRIPALDARQSALIAEMYRESELGRQVSEGFAARAEVMRELGAEMEAASRNAINARGFEGEARRIARLMRGEYNLGFVDVGGWDTHVNEGGTSGYLATRLEELGRGLAAFAAEMGAAWRDSVVVVISEFGRTFRENGNRGTDHGHGTVYWLLGGAIPGGRIAGEQVRLERSTLFQERDYPVLNEYRALFGNLFARLYGLSAPDLSRVFPGANINRGQSPI